MTRSIRTRFTAEEALYYLRARPQFSDMSDQCLSSAIESYASGTSKEHLTLINLGTIERALSGDDLALELEAVSS
ncbi:hypothetical protein IC617_00380 [Neiella sp. HB171785]|uniref:Uncharacterized protein n=1 Tax=Neiella litorisoli TaxID=2771431 RepID=A0A8J6UPA7_9GAMM|nr:hypothetical protein [Neiella litorisoli]MBD1387872.1 hypothetical protein [Neiella litorisoli]